MNGHGQGRYTRGTDHVFRGSVPPTDRPRSILATLPVVAGLLLVVLAVLTGVLTPVEDGVRQRIGQLWPDAPLSARAVLVEVDERSIDKLGPLPWTAQTWQAVAGALAEAGVTEVSAVEPIDRLIRSEGTDLDVAPGARLRSVQAAWAPATGEVPAPFTDTGLSVDLPDHDGVVRGLGADATGSAWCAWVRCPTGQDLATPLSATEADAMPRLPLGALLDGEVRTVVPPGAIVLMGITDPRWSHPVVVGVEGASLSWGEAVSLAIGTLDSRTPRPSLPLGVLLPLLAVLVLTGALVANAEPVMPAEAWLVVLPSAVLAVSLFGVLFGLIELPLVPLALAAVVGPLAEILRLRARTARFIRRMSLQLARADVGLPSRPEGGTEPQAVLHRLSALTWNHLPTDRMLYISAPAGQPPKVVGGYGLAAADLRADLVNAGSLQRLAAQGRCDELIDRGTVCAFIVPVHKATERLGYWVVGWIDGDLAPSPSTLKELARWSDEQTVTAAGAGSFGWLLRMDKELDAISVALARNTQARSRQGQLLQEMDLPMAFADRAGRFVFQNQAFVQAFDLFDEELPRSVRQLVHARSGAVDLSRRMRRVFVGGETVRVEWPEVGRAVCVAGVGGEVPTGVVVWLERASSQRRSAAQDGTCPVEAMRSLVDLGRIDLVSPAEVAPVVANAAELRQGLEDLLLIGEKAAANGIRPKVILRDVPEGLRVNIRWRGLTLDEAIIGAFGAGAETAELHSDLIPLARARRRFPDLRLTRGPGRGVRVVFTLPRVSLAS